MELHDFSIRLKELRTEKGLKQADIAALLDCVNRHYQKIEAGKVNVPTSTLLTLAEFFDVSVDYLLGISDIRERTSRPALTVILPQNEYAAKLRDTLLPLLPADTAWRDPADGLSGLQGRKLLFAIALDAGGCNLSYYRMLSLLRLDGQLLDGCTGAVVVDRKSVG